MYEPQELPSKEEHARLESLQSAAIESLQISNNAAQCQRCHNWISIVGTMTKSSSKSKGNRIHTLDIRIKWQQRYNPKNNAHNIDTSLYQSLLLRD
jgi:hypothetical protein